MTCVAIAALAAAAWAWRRPTSASPVPPMRFTLELPDSQDITANIGTRALAISPDGAEIVYIGHNVAREPRALQKAPRRVDAARNRQALSGRWILYSPLRESLRSSRSDRAFATLPTDGRPSARIVENAGRTSWGEGGVIAFIRGSSLWRSNSTAVRPSG